MQSCLLLVFGVHCTSGRCSCKVRRLVCMRCTSLMYLHGASTGVEAREIRCPVCRALSDRHALCQPANVGTASPSELCRGFCCTELAYHCITYMYADVCYCSACMPRIPTGRRRGAVLAPGQGVVDFPPDRASDRWVDVVRSVLAGILCRRIHARVQMLPGLHGGV